MSSTADPSELRQRRVLESILLVWLVVPIRHSTHTLKRREACASSQFALRIPILNREVLASETLITFAFYAMHPSHSNIVSLNYRKGIIKL